MYRYLTHLKLDYDEDLLRSEVEELEHKPFAPEHCYFRDTWLKARLKENIELYPNIHKLHQLFPNSIVVSYRQQANTDVHMHIDPATECAINIILADDYAPIIFEGIGEIQYKCALLNVQKNHSVPAYPKERLLLKFAYLKEPYEDIRKQLNDRIREDI